LDIPFLILMPLCLAIPGILGLYFGYESFRRLNAGTVRRLVAGYSIFLFIFIITMLPNLWRLGRLKDTSQHAINSLFVTLVTVAVYGFASRYLLRLCGLPYPPLRQSLGRLPISLIAIETYLTAQSVILDLAPLRKGEKYLHEWPWDLVALPASIALAVIVYKIGMRLFGAKTFE
jgi:hypothetical protein